MVGLTDNAIIYPKVIEDVEKCKEEKDVINEETEEMDEYNPDELKSKEINEETLKIKVSKGVNTIDSNKYDTINIKDYFKKNDFTKFYSTCEDYDDKKYVKTYDLISLKQAGRKNSRCIIF